MREHLISKIEEYAKLFEDRGREANRWDSSHVAMREIDADIAMAYDEICDIISGIEDK
ncbi:hypothetical protein fHeYen901_126 [Yersinia phage fHe-Yen9-01]|uniref:Uncharacterized protein n=1 Tax=Yersinia phage fHe-Yen9-01 TaxID=1965363 RepID=A0A1V0DXL9_9CAUD|nr:hypothetical protein KNT60_gp125 [Yersinia phage fHe-Yen9-01]ARB05899.1 hypothetical protein fHeYen901_126 [Yersinia phage fHe-Yen9-01]